MSSVSNSSEVISVQDLTLTYTVYFDRTHSLKEFVMNQLHRRKYVERASEDFNGLNRVNLHVKEGERLGVIGRNGAGKSSLLKVIAGILKPSQGTVKTRGSIHPLIEISAGFNPEFSGRENIYLNGYMLGFERKNIKAKEKEIIEFSELSEFIDVPVKYYSSGMSVRLAFTIATSIDPEILIFDEMLSAGDAAFIEKAKARMQTLIDRARAILLVSHDLELIKNFTTRTIVLHHGEIIFDGAPKEAVKTYLALPTASA
ncbi:MAG: hypothetical protein C5B49_15095 [Bdellovibrio sp.]|nr:MAG: hypothetical protein C5B49_15095 [Bdellovibrio sp.]